MALTKRHGTRNFQTLVEQGVGTDGMNGISRYLEVQLSAQLQMVTAVKWLRHSGNNTKLDCPGWRSAR